MPKLEIENKVNVKTPHIEMVCQKIIDQAQAHLMSVSQSINMDAMKRAYNAGYEVGRIEGFDKGLDAQIKEDETVD